MPGGNFSKATTFDDIQSSCGNKDPQEMEPQPPPNHPGLAKNLHHSNVDFSNQKDEKIDFFFNIRYIILKDSICFGGYETLCQLSVMKKKSLNVRMKMQNNSCSTTQTVAHMCEYSQTFPHAANISLRTPYTYTHLPTVAICSCLILAEAQIQCMTQNPRGE